MAETYEGERWFFPYEDDEETGDLVERVIDARSAYWTSSPIGKSDLPPGVKIGNPIGNAPKIPAWEKDWDWKGYADGLPD